MPEQYALVHLDWDLEKPFVAALEHFYPRIKPRGVLMMDDYRSLYWEGAKNAIDRFFSDKTEFIIPVPDKSGSCSIQNLRHHTTGGNRG